MNELSYLVFGAALLGVTPLSAAPTTTVIYQPMVSTGLAAHEPFKATLTPHGSGRRNDMGQSILAG